MANNLPGGYREIPLVDLRRMRMLVNHSMRLPTNGSL